MEKLEEKFKEQIKEECIENTLPKYPKPTKEDSLQTVHLLSIEKIEQRTEKWYKTRMNMITASDWAAALNEGKFKNRNDLILKKCGKGKVFKGNIYTEWGVKYEDVAIRMYEVRNGTGVHEFGVLQHPKYDFLGASPDGITGEGIMLEIKCPLKRKLIIGKVPSNYMTQIQGQLEVCDLNLCDYLECQLEEYKSSDDYFDDMLDEKSMDKNVNPKILEDVELKKKYDNKDIFNRTKNGMEKGMTLIYEDKDKNKKYIHSELGISKDEYGRWKEKIENYNSIHTPTFKYVKTTYWKLIRFNCVRVRRDKLWFKEALPKLTELWNLVKHHRKVGCKNILPVPKKSPWHFELKDDINSENDDFTKLLEEMEL